MAQPEEYEVLLTSQHLWDSGDYLAWQRRGIPIAKFDECVRMACHSMKWPFVDREHFHPALLHRLRLWEYSKTKRLLQWDWNHFAKPVDNATFLVMMAESLRFEKCGDRRSNRRPEPHGFQVEIGRSQYWPRFARTWRIARP
jgi:hypothetical protein